MTNGKCIFDWDREHERYVVKESSKKVVPCGGRIYYLKKIWHPVFYVVGTKGEYAPISDFVYDELRKKDKEKYGKNAVVQICKKIYDYNENLRKKKAEKSAEVLDSEIKRIKKGRQVFA